jgi:branched-chain amino acid transport system permease protein
VNEAVAYILLVLVLLVRPTGLLKGRPVKRLLLFGLILLLVVLAIYPMRGTGYGVRFMLQLFMWIALAQSWNLISGLTGYVSFGHIAFFGMGAYTAGILIVKLD